MNREVPDRNKILKIRFSCMFQLNQSKNEITSSNVQRNYGIDLLRIVAAVYIVFIHAIGQGGVLSNLVKGTLPYSIMWTLQIVGNCGVDTFILISGYTSISQKERKDIWSRPILLWLEVLYYNVLIYLIWNVTHKLPIVSEDLLRAFFPVTNTTYWYLSIFIGFSAVRPILDKGIREMDEKYLRQVFAIISLLFCIYPLLYNGFGINDGFSVIWFVVLYSLAAIAKKCKIGENLPIAGIFAIMLGVVTITWLWKIKDIRLYIFDRTIKSATLLTYASPTITGIAFLHILAFSKFKLSNTITKIIRFAAPSAFAVYIINTHPLYWNNELKNRFAAAEFRRFSVFFPRVLIYVFSFVIISILIDKVRQCIFKKLRLQKKIEVLFAHI